MCSLHMAAVGRPLGADPGLIVGGGGLSIPRALARAKFYVLRPLLTSFPHTTCYTKKK